MSYNILIFRMGGGDFIGGVRRGCREEIVVVFGFIIKEFLVGSCLLISYLIKWFNINYRRI